MVDASGTAANHGPRSAEPPRRLRFSSWSIVRSVLVVLAILIVMAIVVAASTPLWWLAIATSVAGLLLPAVLWLRRFMPFGLAIAVVVIGIILITGLIGYRGFDEVHSQFVTLQTNAINGAKDLERSKQFGQVASEFGLADKVTRAFTTLPAQIGGGDTATAVQTMASSGGALFAIAMLSLLMLIFGRRLVRDATKQITNPIVEQQVRGLVFESYRASSRYVWLMGVRAVVVGVVAGVLCALAGLQTPTALGLWFALLSLIPGLGLVVAALPLAIYEGITSVPLAIFVICLALLVQALDITFVQRRIEAASVRIGPGLTIMAVLIGLQLYGPGGVLVMLAVVVFAMAFGELLTRGDRDVFTAFRALVTPDATATSVEPPGDGPVRSSA